MPSPGAPADRAAAWPVFFVLHRHPDAGRPHSGQILPFSVE
jgi:hypothetical protein